MTQIYRLVRRVNFTQQSGRNPEVRGMEEVYVNGQRQVRYFGDPEWKEIASNNDSSEVNAFLTNGITDPFSENPFERSFSTPLRSLLFSPEAFVNDSAIPREFDRWNEGELASPQPNPINDIQQSVSYGVNKISRIVKNLPSALKAAWKVMNQ
ncbi:MAG: hypothetical protein AAF528_11445 [Cyanobacteria bacterium P01_C01_bin.121]